MKIFLYQFYLFFIYLKIGLFCIEFNTFLSERIFFVSNLAEAHLLIKKF